MGGNALKKVVTRRYSQKEYFDLFYEIRDIMYPHIKGNPCDHFVLLTSYENKEDYGDMDILINKDYVDVEWLKKEGIKSLFNYTDHYNNGNVFSFDYKEFQIDFIFTKNKYFNTSYTYYSFNDLGNLMGRVANRFGVRYGHMGLEKKLYTEDRTKILDVIFLSDNREKIFDFLGFDYNRYKEGFEELEDIFQYVIGSKYFSKELFAFENLDHQNRTRNRKRKTYQAFIDYINSREIDGYKFEEDREVYLAKINEYFPEINIFEQVRIAREKEQLKKEVKKKFNGNIVRELTGLDGEELGKFIGGFKDYINEIKPFDEYVLSNSEDSIKSHILGMWKIDSLVNGLTILTPTREKWKSPDGVVYNEYKLYE